MISSDAAYKQTRKTKKKQKIKITLLKFQQNVVIEYY